MMQITRPLLQQLREEMNAALAVVAAKHGLVIRCGNASFSAGSATFKVDVIPGGAEADAPFAVERAKAADLWRLTYVVGLDKAWLHRSFEFAGKAYRIEGLLPRGRFPILCSCNGRMVKMALDHLNAAKWLDEKAAP